MRSNFELFSKGKHYINRFFYNRKRRMFPALNKGGVAALEQDIFVAELLDYKKNGVFIDIGANDGVTISNSYYFEKELGWRGVAVEPIPSIFKTLEKNRSCDQFNGCVTLTPGKANFVEIVGASNMLSTLADNDTGLTARRLSKSVERNNLERRELEVECITFSMLVERFNIKAVDFLSLDIEGGELELLKAIDFDETPIKVISVENNYYTDAIRNYLEAEGFVYMGTFKVDEIYLFGGNALRESLKG